jgi:hypothetical protein
MIDDAGQTVFVGYKEPGKEAIRRLRHGGPSRDVFRELQSYGVSVYPRTLHALQVQSAVELLHDTAWVLVSDAHYHPRLGLEAEPQGGEGFIV